MGRMLKALRQLEVKAPQPTPSSRSTPVGPPKPEVETISDCTSAVPATIEAALGRIETAAAALDLPEHEVPSTTPAPCWPIPLTEQHRQAYCRLAQSILSQASQPDHATLMFTGPAGGEGKTELLVCLAAALAQQVSDRILLIDANLHSPDLAAYLGVQSPRGLAHVLAGTVQWQQVLQASSLPHLDILPGTRFPGPELGPPEQANLPQLLEELRGIYRLILIDAASLVHPDVAPMAAQCQGTYLIVRLRHNTARQLTRALQAIGHWRAHLLGGIVVGG